MARLPRLVAPGLLHLVVHRAQGTAPVFSDPVDHQLYLDALGAAARESRVAIHGYGLFDAEARLLLTPADAASLGALMQSVGLRFVRPFNLRHQRRGSPWEGRFRSTVVDAEAHFLTCLRYAEGAVDADLLPVWSSAAHHVGSHVDGLITEHAGYWALGNTPFEREAAYRQRLGVGVALDELARVGNAVLNGWVLGSAAFAAQVEEQAGRRALPLARGRPKRDRGGDEAPRRGTQ